MQSNRELSICDRMRKILNIMTNICMVSLVCLCVLLKMKVKIKNTYLYMYLDVVDNRNCRCNRDNTKESYVEGIQII